MRVPAEDVKRPEAEDHHAAQNREDRGVKDAAGAPDRVGADDVWAGLMRVQRKLTFLTFLGPGYVCLRWGRFGRIPAVVVWV
jgi:hypothetical protein